VKKINFKQGGIMEKLLIFVYSAYFFTFLVLLFIGIKSFLSFQRSHKNISSFDVDSKNINNKK
tara:strand:- start:2059 stop:2247 length:189 start_codon:yes stop_codon:yes gene_type:complete